MNPSLIEELVDRIDDLEERITALEQENDALEERVEIQKEQLKQREDELEQYEQLVSENEAKIDDLEADLDAATDHRKHLQQRLHTLESEQTPSSSEEDPDTNRSPLQQLVRLPSKAVSKLTANQQRAQFIAKDIAEYAQKVPAGFAIDSRTIRTVLNAKEGQTPHTQTVTRVMDFLDEFGKEGVRIVKRRGTKRLIFSAAAVSKLDAESSNSPSRPITDVVMSWCR